MGSNPAAPTKRILKIAEPKFDFPQFRRRDIESGRLDLAQVLADELAIAITASRLPHGTRKQNCIAHKLFAFVTMNWRAKPLVSYLVIIQPIASTTTDTGRTVAFHLDNTVYENGIKVSDAEMAALNVTGAFFQGEWNYTVAPRRSDG